MMKSDKTRQRIYGMCSGLGVIGLAGFLNHIETAPSWMLVMLLVLGFGVFVDAIFNYDVKELKHNEHAETK